MHTTTSVLIQAPRERIFATAAALEKWPELLPHYRYIQFLEKGRDRNVVIMAANRSGIPVTWTSEQVIDRKAMEIRFTHLRSWTKGMQVVWTFEQTPDGVLVEIVHDLRFRFRPLAPLAEWIIGSFFINHIASQTLRCMKWQIEACS